MNICGTEFDLESPKSIYINCDCMDGMKGFPDKYFDLAICDPPYGRKEHGGHRRGGYVKQKNGSKIFVKDGEYTKRDWDNEPPGREYFDELTRVSKHQIIFGANYFDYPLPGGRIIWDKCNDGSNQSDAEIAYCSMHNRVDIFRYMWRGMFQGKSVSEGTIQQGNKKMNEKRIHPTQKPVNLYRWILQKYKIPREWKILDTHVGSGSSLIAFREAGLRYVGFEIDEYYYRLSKERVAAETAQMNLFDFMGV